MRKTPSRTTSITDLRDSASPQRKQRTQGKLETFMLKINGQRLWSSLMELAEIGGTPLGGVKRVTCTDEDRRGREWFTKQVTALGCTVDIDPMGNMFARRPGKNNTLDPVMMGSHLDSQPTGGKFDGAYGVLAGLEVLRTLTDQKIVTEHPLELVSWTNEEGARFSPAMIGSGVFIGEFTLEYAYGREDIDGVKQGDELKRIGYIGTSPLGQRKFAAAFELHIEQGPILELEGKQIGVVGGVQGIRWYDLVLTGEETHSGTCPMSYRRDPVMACTSLIDRIYALADKHGEQARVTLARIVPTPNVRNTVPGTLLITIDFRHPDPDVLAAMDADLRAIVASGEPGGRVKVSVEQIWYSPPVVFAPVCVDAVRSGAAELGYSTIEMYSGAGHDSVYISKVAPTSMIFIPCKDGLSHNERESITPEDAANGANVLLQAVLKLAHGAST
jgi:beta-ureidopropionase / N-carbamoyl-L-amino-acid hydrolase